LKKAEYDFLNWTSLPSSRKLFNDVGREKDYVVIDLIENLAVTPGKTLTIQANIKTKDVVISKSAALIMFEKSGWFG